MTNLIKDRVKSKVKESDKQTRVRFIKNNIILSIILALVVVVSLAYYLVYPQPVKAEEFGLGNNYDEIIALNNQFSGNVPLSIDSITTDSTLGDKRVVALYLFLRKYNSPMASPEIAKAFVDEADTNGFGDKWTLLVAISGIESGFGRIIPYHYKISSYNAWGWSGGSKYGRWSYFDSWVHAVKVVSKGLSRYGVNNLVPERMMSTYCPPCAHPDNKGKWAKTVNQYINEIKQIHAGIP